MYLRRLSILVCPDFQDDHGVRVREAVGPDGRIGVLERRRDRRHGGRQVNFSSGEFLARALGLSPAIYLVLFCHCIYFLFIMASKVAFVSTSFHAGIYISRYPRLVCMS